MIPWLSRSYIFPSVETALVEPNGLLAAGGDLHPDRILTAYRQGIFPWYSEGDPILWWSPNPRMVLDPGRLKISRSLAKTLRNSEYQVRLDTAFGKVIANCSKIARHGQNGTWISPEMLEAYVLLHHSGHAHSVETWYEGELVGGLYGIAIGSAFFGESMFAVKRDASKIALAHLCAFLKERRFGIIDCQMETSHLRSLGANPISRADFVAQVETLCARLQPPGHWSPNAVDGIFRPLR